MSKTLLNKYKQKSVVITLNQQILLADMESAYALASDGEVAHELSLDKIFQEHLGQALQRLAFRRAEKGVAPRKVLDLKLSAAYAKDISGYVSEKSLIVIPHYIMRHIHDDHFIGRISPKKVEILLQRLESNGIVLADLPLDEKYVEYTADFRNGGGEILQAAIASLQQPAKVGAVPVRTKTRIFFEKLATAIKKGLHL